MLRCRARSWRLAYAWKGPSSPPLATPLWRAWVQPSQSLASPQRTLWRSTGSYERRTEQQDTLDEINRKIVDFGKAKELDRAFSMYNYLKHDLSMPPTPKTLSLLLEACARNRDDQRAFDLFYEAQREGVQVDVEVYNAMLHVCCTSQKYQRADLILQQMSDAQVAANLTTVHRLIQLAIEGGQMEEACKHFDSIQTQPFEASVITYNLMIRGWLRQGDKSTALRLFHEMKESRLLPNQDTYSLLIDQSSTEEAFQLLKEMKASKIKITLKVYNAFIAACGKDGNAQRALQAYEIMKEHQVQPDRVTYNTLMACAVKGRLWEEARSLYAAMQAQGLEPNLSTYNTLIVLYSKTGAVNEVMELLGEMDARHIQRNVTTYNSLLALCLKRQDFVTADRFLDRMHQDHVEPNKTTKTYVDQLNELRPSVEGEEGEEYGSGEEDTDMDAASEDEGHEHVHSGAAPDADTVGNLERIVNNYDEGAMNTQIEKELKEYQHKCGFVMEDNRLALRMEEGTGRPGTMGDYCELIELLGDKEDTDNCFRVLDLLKKQSKDQIAPNIYNAVIRACGKSGELSRIAHVVNQMDEDRINVEVGTYNSVIAAQTMCLDYQRAVEALEIMDTDGVKPDSTTFEILLEMIASEIQDRDGEAQAKKDGQYYRDNSDDERGEEDEGHDDLMEDERANDDSDSSPTPEEATDEELVQMLRTVISRFERSNLAVDEGLHSLLVCAHFTLKDYTKAVDEYRKLRQARFSPSIDAVGSILTIATLERRPELITEVAELMPLLPEGPDKEIIRELLTNVGMPMDTE